MEDERLNQMHMTSLCKRMEDLWTKEDITELFAVIPDSVTQGSKFILYGKLFSKPNVNFQAFLNTMKRAWKIELVKCEMIEQGFFLFTFSYVEENERGLESGPWSFVINLLVLKERDPIIHEHCYEFSHYPF
ncbi:hypothetical protein BT93_D0637 [Corymbia citriodora subsp. variegata]|nr:hypothetical protein BT93_D0637 [Corymbia citriodora subsp. variegata]